MLRNLLLLLLCGAVFCSITCPDGVRCNDQQTCCNTEQGYKCCPYPNAVCCADREHCCPFGYVCDQTEKLCVKRWGNGPQTLREEAPLWVKQAPLQEGQAPPSVDQAPPSVVYCDNFYQCPDGYTCCRHPGGGYTCCPYSPARCCLDGYHCCPYGYDCDYTYTHCIRPGVPHPFSQRRPSTRPADPVDVPHQASSSGVSAQPAAVTHSPLGEEPVQEGGVIRCDSQHYCPKGSSCCKNQSQQWSCCPYLLGVCCSDGTHCCEYGYSCDPTSKVCQRSLPSL